MTNFFSTLTKTRLGLAVIGLFSSLVMLAACGDTATSLPASSVSPTTGLTSNTAIPTVARPTPQAVSSVAATTPGGSGAAPTTNSAANPAANSSPCSLVTKAEAEAILGEAVKEPTEQYGGCTYYLATPKPGTLSGIPWMSVTHTQGTRDNFNSAVKTYEIAGPAKPESGLGDYAASASGFLFILKGSNIISIQPGNTQIPAQQVRAFALKALGRV